MTAIRQSPLFRAHERSGASFVDHHGWRVPSHFTDARQEAEQLAKAVVVVDATWVVKLDLKNAAPELSGARAWCLGRNHYLVTCDPSERDSVLKQLDSASAYVTDVTSVYAQFLLAGPRSRDLLRKLTSLNVGTLANLACGQASVAHVAAKVLREDLAEVPAFHILVGREYGESVWEAILHAGHEFHILPAGLRALGGRA